MLRTRQRGSPAKSSSAARRGPDERADRPGPVCGGRVDSVSTGAPRDLVDSTPMRLGDVVVTEVLARSAI
jgi:hypothetical protein